MCPQLVCLNQDGTYYEGYLSVLDQEFHLAITLPPNRLLKDAHIDVEPKVFYLLQEYQTLVKQRLNQCSGLATFLQELKVLLEQVLDQPSQEQYIRVSSQLIDELNSINWERLVYISPTFHEVHISADDEHQRRHILKVQLHSEHPRVAPTCNHDLPSKFKFVWTPSSTLKDLLSQFENTIQSYQVFWDVMGEIDQKTWVLEPEKPNYSATYRRIAISSNSSIQITLDPCHPENLAQCQFMGADSIVDPLKQKLNFNLENWDPHRTVLQNLEDLMEMEFPSPNNTKKEEFIGECGICYTYRLDMELPTKVCENPQCGQPYHQSCLHEWLKTLSTSRYSFNIVFGECPMCTKPITVTMTTGD